jgi:hypothetical protein
VARRLTAALATIPLLVATAKGCDNQASPSSIPDGSTQISKNMTGFWNAPGGPRCRWWMQRGGSITDNGNTTGPLKHRVQQKGPAADQSQTNLIGIGNVGDTLKSDGCGGWTQ